MSVVYLGGFGAALFARALLFELLVLELFLLGELLEFLANELVPFFFGCTTILFTLTACAAHAA